MDYTKVAMELIDQGKPDMAKQILSYQDDTKAHEIIANLHNLLEVYSIDWVFNNKPSTKAKDILEEGLRDTPPPETLPLEEVYFLLDFVKEKEVVELRQEEESIPPTEAIHFDSRTVLESIEQFNSVLEVLGIDKFLRIFNIEKQLVLLTIGWLDKVCTTREIYKHALRVRSYFGLDQDPRWQEEYTDGKNKMHQILSTNISLLKRTGYLNKVTTPNDFSRRMQVEITPIGLEVAKLINLKVKGPLMIV